MTEYDNSPEAIEEYMSGYRRTANWVSRQSDFPNFSPSIAPSVIEDLSDGISLSDSDRYSSKSLPPRMLLHYDDGRPDVPLNDYVAPPRQASASRRPQHPPHPHPPAAAMAHPTAHEPEEIRVLPSKSSGSSNSIIPPRGARRRRANSASNTSGLPGAQALVGEHVPPYPQQIAVYAPASRQASPLTHAESYPPSRLSGAPSAAPPPQSYRGPASQRGRSSSAGPSRGPPPVAYPQPAQVPTPPHPSHVSPSQHARSMYYQPTPPQTPHHPGHPRLDSRPGSRQGAHPHDEYAQQQAMLHESTSRQPSRHSRHMSLQPQQTSPHDGVLQQSAHHNRHTSTHSQQAMLTPPDTPSSHHRSRHIAEGVTSRGRAPVVVSTRGSSRPGSQPPALVYAPRNTAPIDAHYSPPPVVPRSMRARDEYGYAQDPAAQPERGRRSVDHSRGRSGKENAVPVPAAVPRRQSTAVTSHTLSTESAVMVDTPGRSGRSRSQDVHSHRRRDKSVPRTESSASTYYVLANKGQKVHVIMPDDEGLYNPVPSNRSPDLSRSPGSSQSHSTQFPVTEGDPAHLAGRKGPSLLGKFLSSLKVDRRKRADSAPPAALDAGARPLFKKSPVMASFRTQATKVG